MFDLAAFTFKLFQHRRKRNQDVGAQTYWAGPNEGMESSSSRGWAACAHLICSPPKSLSEPLPDAQERPLGQGDREVSHPRRWEQMQSVPTLSTQSRQSQQDPFGQCQPSVTTESLWSRAQ